MAENPENLSKLLRTGEAAALIGVRPATISKAWMSGELSGYYLPQSKHRRYDPADVLALREQMRVHPADTLHQRLAKARAAKAAKARS